MEGAKREIYEETGCKVEITGILEIINEILEGVNVVCFFFDTKIISENIKADGYFLSTIKNKIDNKIQSMEIIKCIRK